MQAPNLPRLAIATAITAVCTPVAADEAKNNQQIASLEPVVVTATRTPQTADETLASVSVITRDEIVANQVKSLPDLLERQQGLSFARSGAFGKQTSLFMRGTEAGQVLVLVDGIKLGSATTGTTAFQHLPLEQIERVEIVRGPRSSLYGSEAIGGVIQIFTRDGASGETQVSASAMRGENDTDEITASVSGGNDDTRFAVSGKSFDTDGISARTDGFPDDDGYVNDSASAQFSQDFGDSVTWSVQGLIADGNNEFDFCGSFPAPPSQDCETDFTQQVISTQLDAQINSIWSVNLTAGESRDETTNRTDGDFDSSFDTERQELRWQNDLAVNARNLITVGFDYREDEIDSSTDFTDTTRDNTGIFGQWQWSGERANFQTSVRHDDNEDFGDETTGSLAAGYRFGETARVFASVGTGFKAPTFNDLFFPDLGFFRGNPDLDAEESESFEIGISGGRTHRWSINAFHTRIDELIVFDSAAGTVNNLDEGEITGLELTGSTVLAGWDLEGNVTVLDTEQDTDGPNDGNELQRRPENVVSLDVARDFASGVSFGANFQYEDERFDDAANEVELDDFLLVDLRLGYRFTDALSLNATLENALDEEHETVADFNSLDRTLFVRLSYRP